MSPKPPSPVTDHRVPALIVWFLRIITTVFALAVFLQSATAGLFVTGDVGLLAVHAGLGGFTIALGMIQIAAAILLWRPGRGAAGPFWITVVLCGLTVTQNMLGYSRTLTVHFPLGVVIFGAATALAAWAWWGRHDVERGPLRWPGRRS